MNDPIVYRGMTRAELDAGYNNLAAVADSARYLDDWTRRSAAVRARPGAKLDLRYAQAPRACLDFFPASPGGPTLMFIHGGYWQRNAKEMFAFVAEALTAAGINVAVPGYTLAPAARMDAIVAELREATRWLRRNLAALGAGPWLHVSGWSAGGHLAAMLMDQPFLAGGLAISGIFDLEPIRLCYLNHALGLDAPEARRNSPLHTLRGGAPFDVAVGAIELPELQHQSSAYHEARAAQGLPGEFVRLRGCHHFSILEELARPDGILLDLVRRRTRS